MVVMNRLTHYRSGRHFDVSAYYVLAKSAVVAAGGSAEIEWQRSRDCGSFTEQDLLREGAWVILCSGFRESIVRRKFDYISVCFGDWESSCEIVRNARLCVATASHAIGNRAKLDAIVTFAKNICDAGFARYREWLTCKPLEHLLRCPFLGPVTARHLLKNLGFHVAKPDRHLVRLAGKLGYRSVDKLCTEISKATGDPVSVVDLVLWRHCVQFQ